MVQGEKALNELSTSPTAALQAESFAHLKPTDDVPGPPPMRLFGWRGNALRFFRNPIAYMMDLFEHHGKLSRLALGGNRPLLYKPDGPTPGTFFAFGGECNRHILTEEDLFQTRMPPGPNTVAFSQLTKNFFFINGERHRELRKLFAPTFAGDNIRSFHDDVVEFTAQMLESWRDRTTVELCHEANLATLNIASRCFYGLEPSEKDEGLAHMMLRMVNALFSPVTLLPINLPGTPYRNMLSLMDQIVAALGREIENKRQRKQAGKDVLSMMVGEHDRNPSRLTADELVGNAFVMFFAGHDTTAKALIWTLFLIATHPRVHAELLDEIEQKLGKEPPTHDEAAALAYLDCVVKESLRLLPPAIMFAREATRETSLEGYRIPAGSEVIYSPYVSHRNPEIFAHPDRFLPERWRELKPSPWDYLPFGGGPRKCLGTAFGGAQLRTMVAMTIQSYRLEVVPGTRIDLRTNVVMAPKGLLPIRLHKPEPHRSQQPVEVGGFIREMVDFSKPVTP